jgi:ankyrin repeat protein
MHVKEKERINLKETINGLSLLSIEERIAKFKQPDGSTLLHLAIREQDLQAVEDLIKAKVELNQCANDGDTPLHLAIRLNAEDIFDKLISVPEVDPNTGNSQNGWTPLMLAVKYNRENIVQKLVEKNVDINKCDTIYRNTPLHIASEYKLIDMIDILLGNHADIYKVNIRNETPLYTAYWNNYDDVIKALETALNGKLSQFEMDKIKFFIAVTKGDKDKALELYSKHRQLRIERDANNNTWLNIVINYYDNSQKHVELFKAFAEKRIDIEKLIESENNNPFTALFKTCKEKSIIEVMDIINNNYHSDRLPSICNECKDAMQYTVLHWAVKREFINVIRYIIKISPDLCFQKSHNSGNMPLDLALQHSNGSILQALLEGYANNAIISKEPLKQEIATRLGCISNEFAIGDIYRYMVDNLIMNRSSESMLNQENCGRIVNYINENDKISIDYVSYKNNLFLKAIVSGKMEIARSFIQAAKKCAQHETILNCQDWEPKVEKIKGFDDSGKEAFVNQEIPIEKGDTLLHYAVKEYNADLIHFLIEMGADANKQDNAKNTPLHIAIAKGDITLSNSLVSHTRRFWVNKENKTTRELAQDLREKNPQASDRILYILDKNAQKASWEADKSPRKASLSRSPRISKEDKQFISSAKKIKAMEASSLPTSPSHAVSTGPRKRKQSEQEQASSNLPTVKRQLFNKD